MSTYTSIFGGAVVSPSDQSFIQYSLTALVPQVILIWPSSFVDSANYVSNIIQVSASTTGCSLVMPDATQVSVGQASLIVNNGVNTVTLYNSDASTVILSITAGTSYYLWLTNNSLAVGVYSAVLFGTGSLSAVTSVGISSSSPTELIVTGSPITSSGVINLALGADLLALTSLGGATGILVKTGASSYSTATITGTMNQIVVANGSSISGNPTISLASAVSGLTSLVAGNIQLGVGGTNNLSTAGGGNIEMLASLDVLPVSAAASSVRWWDAADAHYVAFKGAASIPASVTWILPTADGTPGQTLSTNGAGTLSWSSAGAGTVNSVIGTVNRITSTGGTNPVIDISAAYVGQTSITTLGTISTGNWDATPVVVQFGGTGATTFTAYGVICGGTTNTGMLQSTANAGLSGQVLTSNGASALPTWQAGGGGITAWANEPTGLTMVANNAYFATSAGSAVTFTIPTIVAFATEFEISGMGSAGWILAANTGQTIIFGNQSSSSGGSWSSSNQYDGIKIVCSVANTTFKVLYGVGNLTPA